MRTKQPSAGSSGTPPRGPGQGPATLRTLHAGDPVRDRYDRESRKLDKIIESNMEKAERLHQEALGWDKPGAQPARGLDDFSLEFERAGREVRRAIVKQMELEKSYRVRLDGKAAEQERVAAAAKQEREARGRAQIEQVVLKVIEGATQQGKPTKG